MFSKEVDVGLPQLDSMRLGTSYRIRCALRGFDVYLRPLTMDETARIISQVAAYLNTVPAAQRTPLFEHWTLAKETLKLASTSDEEKADSTLGDVLLGKLTPDELQHIWKQYQKGLELCDPSLEEMAAEKVKDLVDEVKKNPSLLTELSSWEVVNVCRGLISGV